MSPKTVILSICIPTFNPNLEYLRSLIVPIYSVLPVYALEIVVSDDRSVNFLQIQDMLLLEFPEVNFVSNFGKTGMVENWNNAIQESSGEYFILPGQDDLLEASELGKLLEFIATSQDDIIFVRQSYIDENSLARRDPRIGPKKAKFETHGLKRYKKSELLRIILLQGNVVSDPCGAIVRKDVWAELRGFSSQYRHAIDADFWIRADLAGKNIVAYKSDFASKRIHSDFATKRHIYQGVTSSDRSLLFREYSGYLQNSTELEQARYRVYFHWIFDRLRGAMAPKPSVPRQQFQIFAIFYGFFKYLHSEFSNSLKNGFDERSE